MYMQAYKRACNDRSNRKTKGGKMEKKKLNYGKIFLKKGKRKAKE